LDDHLSEDSTVTRAQLIIRPNSPVELDVGEKAEFSGTDEDRQMLRQISSTVAAYRTSMKALLAGRYSSLAGIAPTHLTDACRMMTFVFADGILVRYDRKTAPHQKGFVGVLEHGSLEAMAPNSQALSFIVQRKLGDLNRANRL
jgi:hypothetical protein